MNKMMQFKQMRPSNHFEPQSTKTHLYLSENTFPFSRHPCCRLAFVDVSSTVWPERNILLFFSVARPVFHLLFILLHIDVCYYIP